MNEISVNIEDSEDKHWWSQWAEFLSDTLFHATMPEDAGYELLWHDRITKYDGMSPEYDRHLVETYKETAILASQILDEKDSYWEAEYIS